ncbi:hypothetical protein [Chryseosolibacter indicus]|uniref:UbiA prenyltransferase family protein n=1 Tax=Chryseosolibacter indicus TaxID=2782351 RepID=A0ABS5VRM2_9BACT|nr:hypothetical protein [Chryseosolibacter indicus]MBT1702661.1 hypothetical protein [Chryseosolibacter indicus]
MNKLLHAYKLLNILSIDVVIGAVISGLFFGKLFKVTILPYGLAVLGLTVWIVYTADHLKDAKDISKPASSTRHLFHQKHFKPILICLMIVLIVDSILLFFIRHQVFIWGLRLAMCVGIYLVINQKLPFLKELFVALMYTIGVLLPSISVTNVHINDYHTLIIVQFFLIALLNLLVYSWVDANTDVKDKMMSFVTYFGPKVLRTLIAILAVITCLIFIAQALLYNFDSVQVILLIMTLILLTVFYFNSFFRKHDLYRLIGDAVFFLPALLLV